MQSKENSDNGSTQVSKTLSGGSIPSFPELSNQKKGKSFFYMNKKILFIYKEKWQSGRMHWFAKSAYNFFYIKGSIPFFSVTFL